MTTSLSIDRLTQIVREGGTAIRTRATLQPAAGEGTKVFPPTYAGARYATEARRLPGREQPVECVVLDSVASQANRLEEALQQAVDVGRLRLPLVEVDFDPFYPGDDQPEDQRLLDPVGRISSLQAPHRIADAILRDSLLGGVPFRDSPLGKRVTGASARNATALLELCPTALVLGMWDSTGPKGGLGAKIERALVSEIVGVDAVVGCRSGSRIDPLAIQRQAGTLYAAKSAGGLRWTLDENDARRDGKKPALFNGDGRPSAANHGNVMPSLVDESGQPLRGGVSISHAELTTVISLPALRRLCFPINGRRDPAVDDAARTVLAALGLCAAVLAAEDGLDLRSRCLLWPTEPFRWELLGRPGTAPEVVGLEGAEAIALLDAAVARATALGLPWATDRVVLQPAPDLVRLVVRSQRLASEKGGDGGEGGDE